MRRIPVALLVAVLAACGGPAASRGAAKEPAEEESSEHDEPEVDTDGLMKKAEDALEAKRNDEAEKNAREVVRVDPKGYPSAYVILGEVASGRAAYGEALRDFEKALELEPNEDSTMVHIAEALEQLGRKTEARDRLRQYVGARAQVSGDVDDALGWAELDEHDAARAEQAFRSALKATGDKDADAYYGLAVVAADRNDARATEKALNAVFALQPERRIEASKDEAFAEVRRSPVVGALFTKKKLLEAEAAAQNKHPGGSAPP
jgi:tetratricopeptide (TPR) repeat protein